MFQTTQIPVGGFDSNFSYLLVCGSDALIVDPCGDVSAIRRAVELLPHAPAPRYILLTHSHRDHVSGIDEVRSFFPAPVCISAASAFPCGRKLNDGEHLPLGAGFVECLATPGHTPDSMCFRTSDASALFTGDTLFIGDCGFCKAEPMFQSMLRLRALPDSLTVYPGHDYGERPHDTLGHQKQVNPYLNAPDLNEFRERLKNLT
ncbi:MAG: MBL fold metallo-hydrolase [bacterium]|nr:MBL fold metallo-hydrolase [bacterium]